MAEIQHIDPMETRAKEAVCQCQLWSAGEIRMPQAKKAILAAHAIGQGCASVHCETHAIGMVFYDLTAMIRRYGLDQRVITERVRWYEENLNEWQDREKRISRKWAAFLMKERPNKEARRKIEKAR